VVTHALIVECSDQPLAIPSDAVDVAMEADTEQIVPAGAGFAVRLDDEAIPLVDLGAALSLRDPVERDALNGSRVLIIKHQERRIALLIDRLIGQQQLTHRALDPFIERSAHFIGTVSLKRGQIALLVNPAAMFRSSGEASIGVHIERHEQSEAQRACVMVVDDSEMSRDLFVGVVRDLGFDVLEAVNGKNALERMVERRPDLVLTDLEMPLLDGFGLIEQLRSSPDLKNIPIIVCSTRGSVDDKKRAAQLGADAYLVKSDFSEQRLETTLMRFLSEPVHGT
jgi:two-component system chemotaxis sensor kinase CheA